MKTAWRDGERVRSVELQPLGGGRFRVQVDDAHFEVECEALEDGRMRLRTDAGATMAEVTVAGARRFVRLGTLDFVLERETATRGRAGGPQHELSAPMNGIVTRVLVEPDDEVHKGQPLLAIEAMKMEHLVTAPRSGVVKEFKFKLGSQVAEGVELVTFETGPVPPEKGS